MWWRTETSAMWRIKCERIWEEIVFIFITNKTWSTSFVRRLSIGSNMPSLPTHAVIISRFPFWTFISPAIVYERIDTKKMLMRLQSFHLCFSSLRFIDGREEEKIIRKDKIILSIDTPSSSRFFTCDFNDGKLALMWVVTNSSVVSAPEIQFIRKFLFILEAREISI